MSWEGKILKKVVDKIGQPNYRMYKKNLICVSICVSNVQMYPH